MARNPAFFSLIVALLFSVLPLAAQSPNTAALVVVVSDPTGAVVKGAKVSVVNSATGAVREATTAADGSTTIAALPLTGKYKIDVSKEAFGNQELTDVDLRSGETATIRVTLQVGPAHAEVTVIGTAEGVRTDPEIGRSIDGPQIDETPILGRKLSSVPLLNSAFRQGKGTGDLYTNQTFVITGAGSRRTVTSTVDGSNNDEVWGRQMPMSTLPISAVQEMTVLSNAFSRSEERRVGKE